MDGAIDNSLGRRGITYVCHMTSCLRLPSIFQHGALFSTEQRRARGIPDSVDPHYWGSPDKEEAFSRVVVCSFLPAWWMCGRHDDELAILLIDAVSVCTTDGALFIPGNSAYNDFPAAEVLTWTGLDSLDACFANPDSYVAGFSEIFVPDTVPWTHFRGIVFPDAEARQYWIERLRTEWHEADRPPPPPERLFVATKSYRGFRFPPNYTPERRIRE